VARKKFYRINHYIQAQTLRVIDQEGKQIGILSLAEAQNRAREANLDLVEVIPKANPPIAKIVDFKKFLYFEQKKEREIKKKTRGGEIKGIRLKPFMAKGDLDVRVRRAEEFLREGNKVKVEVRFLGRQLRQREFGAQILSKFLEAIAHCAKPEQEPKWLGRSLVIVLTLVKDDKKTESQKQEVGDEKISADQNR